MMTTPIRLLAAAAACVLAAPVWNQTGPPKQLTAREMFYAAREETAKAKPAARRTTPKSRPQPAATASTAPATPPGESRADIIPAAYSAAPLGLRYTVLKKTGGQTVEVSPDTVFHSGDHIQLALEVNDNGYLYIVSQGSSGTWEVLFPSPKIENGDNRVSGRRRYVVPQGYMFSFVGQPGVEKLFVIFSRQPEAEMDRLIYSLQGGKRAPAPAPTEAPAPERPSPPPTMLASLMPVNDALIGQFHDLYSRDLIIEKMSDEQAATPEAKADKAVYVVNPKGAADSRVVADIELTHR